jgi:uncharacterized protein YbcV (DUF1398 family)
MICLKLIESQESFDDVVNIIERNFPEINHQYFLSLTKRKKKLFYNFSFYMTDKNVEVYNKLKENYKNILTESIRLGE